MGTPKEQTQTTKKPAGIRQESVRQCKGESQRAGEDFDPRASLRSADEVVTPHSKTHLACTSSCARSVRMLAGGNVKVYQ